MTMISLVELRERLVNRLVVLIMKLSWQNMIYMAIDVAVIVMLFKYPDKMYLAIVWLIIKGWTP